MVFYVWVIKMKPLKVKVSISIDEPVYEKIKERAEYQDRSVSSYINLVLKKHFEQLEKLQNKKTPE